MYGLLFTEVLGSMDQALMIGTALSLAIDALLGQPVYIRHNQQKMHDCSNVVSSTLYKSLGRIQVTVTWTVDRVLSNSRNAWTSVSIQQDGGRSQAAGEWRDETSPRN